MDTDLLMRRQLNSKSLKQGSRGTPRSFRVFQVVKLIEK